MLSDLGLRIHFGHNGTRCPHATEYARRLSVVHTNGFHEVNVSFCECGQPGGHYHGIQVLRSTWFPVTVPEPRTAFTFDVLDSFHHLTLQGKATAWDFYNALLHQTDNAGLNPPSVCHHLVSS